MLHLAEPKHLVNFHIFLLMGYIKLAPLLFYTTKTVTNIVNYYQTSGLSMALQILIQPLITIPPMAGQTVNRVLYC